MCLWILLFLNNRSIVDFCGWRRGEGHKIDALLWFNKCKTPRLVTFYDKEKIHHVQGQKTSIKRA